MLLNIIFHTFSLFFFTVIYFYKLDHLFNIYIKTEVKQLSPKKYLIRFLLKLKAIQYEIASCNENQCSEASWRSWLSGLSVSCYNIVTILLHVHTVCTLFSFSVDSGILTLHLCTEERRVFVRNESSGTTKKSDERSSPDQKRNRGRGITFF